MKWMRVSAIVLAAAAAVWALVSLPNREVSRLNQKVAELEREKSQMIEYARRLSASRRVAQVEILKQRPEADGVVTTLLWQEIGPEGILGRPVALEAIGTQVYIEALVLKFDAQLVGAGDPSRGCSLALFRRVFGDQQRPETAQEFDRASRPPLTDPRQADPLHDHLWGRFWELVESPELAARFGVRVAQCEAPSVPVRAGQVWEVSIDAAGGLNLRRLGDRGA